MDYNTLDNTHHAAHAWTILFEFLPPTFSIDIAPELSLVFAGTNSNE